MPKTISSKRRAVSEANGLRRRKETTAVLIVILAAQTVVEYAATYLMKEPIYDSVLTGIAWVQELLNAHEMRFYDALGMAKPVFLRLCHELEEHSGLQNSKYLGLAEKVAIFLWVCRTGGSQRDARERFQHALGTISMYVCVDLLNRNPEHENRVFHGILNAIVSKTFYNRYVKFPRTDKVPPQIRDNPKFFPFFKGCLGAVDGTHIKSFLPSEDTPHYRDRKGGLSQNVFAACTY